MSEPNASLGLLRRCLTALYMRLPNFLSKRVYALGRRFVFRYAVRRTRNFDQAFEQVRSAQIPGDYLEFGVYRGTSFIMASNAARKHGLKEMRLFAFDSFQGLPNAEGGVYEQGELNCPRDVFLTMIEKAGVDLASVRVVEGFYDETLSDATKSEHALSRVAVAHIDCDLYTSTRCALDFMENMVDVGTVIMFDDWNAFGGAEDKGEKAAFEEWCLRECFEELYLSVDGKCRGFIMTCHPEPAGTIPSDAEQMA